jgi:hypothetical protein
MKTMNYILVGLLALQLLIAGGLYASRQASETETTQMALLVANDSVDNIILKDNAGQQTQLKNINGHWQLPEYYQLPAAQQKVNALIEKLRNTKTGWPVTTTSASQERFEVSDDKHQRELILSQGENTLAQLYLGTSPGFRKLHLRKAGEDVVYAVALESHDFTAQASAWLDPGLLRPDGSIDALTGPDFQINKQGSQWQSTAADTQVVQEEAEKLLNALQNLRVSEARKIPDHDPQAGYILTINVKDKKQRYQFFEHESQQYVHRDEQSLVFKLSKNDYDHITAQTAAQLLTTATTESDEADVVVPNSGARDE